MNDTKRAPVQFNLAGRNGETGETDARGLFSQFRLRLILQTLQNVLIAQNDFFFKYAFIFVVGVQGSRLSAY